MQVCNTINSVKYLYKYVYKGPDMALVELQPAAGQAAPAEGQAPQRAPQQGQQGRDEIKQYQEGRYMSAAEGAFRIFELSMHEEVPNVVRLAVHLPEQQRVDFEPGHAQEALGCSTSTLLGWFKFNQDAKDEHERELRRSNANHPPPSRPRCLDTLYHNFPAIAVWNGHEWQLRKRMHNSRGLPPVGRMYYVDPTDQERFCLRLLLTRVPGACSYQDLRTVRGVEHPTFNAACKALGLLEDDTEWAQCLEEAATFKAPSTLRQLFATVLCFNSVTDAAALWRRFQLELSEDYLHQARQVNPDRQLDAELTDRALRDIGEHINTLSHGAKDLSTFGLPQPAAAPYDPSTVLLKQRDLFPMAQQQATRDRVVPLLNQEQRTIYDAVMAEASRPVGTMDGGAFFVDGVGGACGWLHAGPLSRVDARTHRRAHTHAHARTHPHIHSPPPTYTHRHTHTHTQVPARHSCTRPSCAACAPKAKLPLPWPPPALQRCCWTGAAQRTARSAFRCKACATTRCASSTPTATLLSSSAWPRSSCGTRRP
jgi:hypothetical protein